MLSLCVYFPEERQRLRTKLLRRWSNVTPRALMRAVPLDHLGTQLECIPSVCSGARGSAQGDAHIAGPLEWGGPGRMGSHGSSMLIVVERRQVAGCRGRGLGTWQWERRSAESAPELPAQGLVY